MNVTPAIAGIGGASLVAMIVAFVLHPAQLTAHSVPSPNVPHDVAVIAEPERAQTLVYVTGAVVHPGVYAVSSDARARDALAKAGGAARDADLVAVNLAAHVADGDEIAVPRQGESVRTVSPRTGQRRTAAPARRTKRAPRRNAGSSASAAPPRAVDLNTAAAGELAGLPGLGPALAERIVAFRTLNGPFASVDGLADVAGITPQRLDALTPLLIVSHN